MNLEGVRTRQAQGLHTAQHEVFKIPSLFGSWPSLPCLRGSVEKGMGTADLTLEYSGLENLSCPETLHFAFLTLKTTEKIRAFSWACYKNFSEEKDHLCFDLNLLPPNYKSWNNNNKILLKLLCSNWLSKTKSQLVSSCHLTTFWCAAKMHLA